MDSSESSTTQASSDTSGASSPCPEVLEGDLILETQEDVEAASLLREVNGNVTITGDITNLESLGCLETIQGYLSIRDTQGLLDLAGLHAVTDIGGQLGVYDNPELETLAGLSTLRYASWIHLSGNGITHLGLDRLQATNVITIGDCLPESTGEPLLEDFDGLESLLALGAVEIFGSPRLAGFSGLQAFAQRGGSLNRLKLWFNEQLEPETITEVTEAFGEVSVDVCGNGGGSQDECFCPSPS